MTDIKTLITTRPRMAKVRVKTKKPNSPTTYVITFDVEDGTSFDLDGLEDIESIRLDVDVENELELELVPTTSEIEEPEHEIKLVNHTINEFFTYEHETDSSDAIDVYDEMADMINEFINVHVTYNTPGVTPDNFNVQILQYEDTLE